MPTLRSMYALIGELAAVSPRLVLMRGRDYFRIEELWRRARQDWQKEGPLFKGALSDPIYWTERDPHGKLILKGSTPQGGEFVSFVEAGSDVATTVSD